MRYVSLFLLCLSITACSTGTDSGSDQPATPVPLAVGNTWVFDVEMDDRVTTDTLKVVSDTLIGDTTWFELHSDEHKIQACISGFVTNLEDGLYLYNGAEKANENILLFETEPTENEPRYIDTGRNAWFNIYEGEILNDDFDVTANKYAIEYEYIVSGDVTYQFDQVYRFDRVVSPDVGFIRWESAYMKNANDSTLTLSSYFSINLQEFIPGDGQ